MNWLLILVVLLVAGNIVWGFFRGFLRVVYSMAAWILILFFCYVCNAVCCRLDDRTHRPGYQN